MNLELKNPHSVLAALETRPLDVIEVRMQHEQHDGAWKEVCRRAEAAGVLVQRGGGEPRAGRRQRRHAASSNEGRVGSALAVVRPRAETPLDEIFNPTTGKSSFMEQSPTDGNLVDGQSNSRGLWLALDCLQDPHNVGAIFRTAAFFGVRGLIATRDRSAPMNGTVYDVASGGVECVPHAQPPNLSRALEAAKEAGLWIVGASEHASQDASELPLDRPWLLVLGNEEQGLRQLTQKQCDELCRLTSRGPIHSLNVSVAAALLMSRLSGQ